MTPYRHVMEDGELPADVLEQYPALEPPPDPNRVTAVWLLSVIVIAFGFVLVMAAGQWWQISSSLPELPQLTPTLNFVDECYAQNTSDEPVNIYAARDTESTLVGRIEPGDYRRVVRQLSGWYQIRSNIAPDWVQADQVVLVGEGC